MDYPAYRKFLVAGLGAFIIVLSQIAGVTVAEDVDDNVLRIFDSAVAILTAFGVKQASNDPQ